ncbi:MAG TPA: DedA family protein [Candidatus Polarisedimenticolaceae bacterium]|nr:DedA family protein [Candidatus Polarisedimenticolaceae bacterium]
MLHDLVDIFLHLDRHLGEFVTAHGSWTYGVLFTIVFLETGVVVTPILPGDSLLFACGALAAAGTLQPALLFLVLSFAAILGDGTNYSIGKLIGPRAFTGNIRFLKREYLERTRAFYERHGGKTIFLARFVPIVRTFAPFVAGIGTMPYLRFAAYNVVGGFAWVGLCLGAGYLFGNIPFVKQNFSVVILGIVVVSVLPLVVEWLRHRKSTVNS